MKSKYIKKILLYATPICLYVVTIILYPFLLDKIEYLVVPEIVCRINLLFGLILFIYTSINLDSKLIKFVQREFRQEFESYINAQQDNIDTKLVKFFQPMNPLKSKLLTYDRYTLPMWSIWLFFEAFCYIVCAFTIISPSFTLRSNDKASLMAEEKKQRVFFCITEDRHLPNGVIESMIDYQYDDSGILSGKKYYDGEGKIEKYVDYIYNNKRQLIKTEVYKPLKKSGTTQEFYFDASDTDNKMYAYNENGMCIFQRSGLNSERKYEYTYDNNGRVSEIRCACNNEFEYLQEYKYRFDGNIKKEVICKGKTIILFNKWELFINPTVTRYIYDNMGILVKTKCDDNTVANFFYDEYNNLIRKEVFISGRMAYYTEYSYDVGVMQN